MAVYRGGKGRCSPKKRIVNGKIVKRVGTGIIGCKCVRNGIPNRYGGNGVRSTRSEYVTGR